MRFLTESSDCIDATEKRSVELVSSWCRLADLDPTDTFPLDIEGAAAVLHAGGYDVDPDELRRLADLGQIPRIEYFDAKDLLAVAASLEGRRQWRLDSPHAEKIHPTMRHMRTLIERGDLDSIREALAGFDIRFALILLAEADSRELREKCLTTVMGLLAIEGVKV